MRRVGRFEVRLSRLSEAEALLGSLGPAHVRRPGWLEVLIVRVKPKDPQHPPESRKVTGDDALEVRHPALVPVREPLLRQESHRDQDLDGGNDVAAAEETIHRAHDARVERILPIPSNRVLASCHMRRVPQAAAREQAKTARCRGRRIFRLSALLSSGRR